MSTPKRTGHNQAQLQFDWLLPAEPFLRVSEIAAVTGMGSTFLEEHFADMCHRYAEDKRTRPPMRIPRAFVIVMLVKSAKYDGATKRQALASCFREFDTPSLLRLRDEIDALTAA